MLKILVLGSINIDHSYEVHRIVRPGETIASTAYRTAWGGKGLNQAIALAKAGAKTGLAAQLSSVDKPMLDEFCAPFGLDTSKVRGMDIPTGHAIIQVESSGQNSIIIAAGANGMMGDETISAIDEYLPGDILLLQNEINRMPEIIRRGKEKGMTIVLNPSPCSGEMMDWPLELVDIFILNETEGQFISGSSQVEDMLRIMGDRFQNAGIVLTLGADGSIYRKGSEEYRVPAMKVEAVDTTAAGDTYTGFFLAGISAGITVKAAMELATRAAAITVSRPGAAESIPTARELDTSCLSQKNP